MERALFYLFGGIAVVASLAMVTRRNPLSRTSHEHGAFELCKGLFEAYPGWNIQMIDGFIQEQ